VTGRRVPEGDAGCDSITGVTAQIRGYRSLDEEDVVQLSLRAWAPVFASLEQSLGPEIFLRLYGDWRQHQATAVRNTLNNSEMQVWVAEAERGLVGFVAATLRSEVVGEIEMLAVDPYDQGRGTGSALTRHATAWLRDRGMRVAVVETGGDPGHAPARRVYQEAGYTMLPVARYFMAL
jgi:GNAT superfamily N-acetyltransferase